MPHRSAFLVLGILMIGVSSGTFVAYLSPEEVFSGLEVPETSSVSSTSESSAVSEAANQVASQGNTQSTQTQQQASDAAMQGYQQQMVNSASAMQQYQQQASARQGQQASAAAMQGYQEQASASQVQEQGNDASTAVIQQQYQEQASAPVMQEQPVSRATAPAFYRSGEKVEKQNSADEGMQNSIPPFMGEGMATSSDMMLPNDSNALPPELLDTFMDTPPETSGEPNGDATTVETTSAGTTQEPITEEAQKAAAPEQKQSGSIVMAIVSRLKYIAAAVLLGASGFLFLMKKKPKVMPAPVQAAPVTSAPAAPAAPVQESSERLEHALNAMGAMESNEMVGLGNTPPPTENNG